MQICQSVNPRLPQKSKSIKKLSDLLIKVKDINRKHAKAAAKLKVDLKLDNLFDISTSSYTLEVLPCKRINCDVE